LRRATDELFAHGVDPVLFCEDRLRFYDGKRFIPDPWQARLLRSNAPNLILNVGRQCGKSTVVASLAVHSALYQPGSLAILISPSLRQSAELMLKCREFLHSLGPTVALPEDNKRSPTKAASSRCRATTRGRSAASARQPWLSRTKLLS
jgi:hypothetical protein